MKSNGFYDKSQRKFQALNPWLNRPLRRTHRNARFLHRMRLSLLTPSVLRHRKLAPHTK